MARRSGSLALPLGVFVCFFLSGFSGLIYEVVWTRLLLTVFGASIYAVSTVLAAFMGGLALGSLLGGRLADRWPRPLLAYGVLEIGISAVALAVPVLLHSFEPIYQAVYRTSYASYFNLSLLRFGLTFVTLLVPTTFMGATLPLLARFLVRRSATTGSRIGGLYAINTLGAVTGTFLAGFVLIAELGVQYTTWFAATLSALAGAVAMALSWRAESPRAAITSVEHEPTKPEPLDGTELPGRFVGFVLATYGIAGFVALAYQVFWTRTLVFQFEALGNTTYAFSAMLTVFLVGLASGSSVMSTLVDRRRDAVRLYGAIQVLMGLAGVYSLLLLTGNYFAPNSSVAGLSRTPTSWLADVATTFLRTAIIIGPATFLMGMAFPLAVRICVRHRHRVGTVTGRLYAVNTLGAILGSFAAGFLIIPFVGLSRGLLALGLVNVINGSLVLVLNPLQRRTARRRWALSAVALLGGLFVVLPGEYRFMPSHFRSMPKFLSSIVAYEEGPLATTAVVEDAYGYRRILVDGVHVAGTDFSFLTDQKSLAHTPMLLLENPETALTVGFGSGGASYSFLLYDELKRLDCVEISETVPTMAPWLRESNYGVLDEWAGGPVAGRTFHDGRYRILLDDVRSYLRFTERKYDVIATDCTDLRYKSNANLYDVEYFQLCRERLTDEGMVVVWFPLITLDEEIFACAMKTFAHVFPNMTMWHMHNVPTHYLLLVGNKHDRPLRINLERLRERIQRPKIRADLAEVWLHQPEKLLTCYIASAPDLREDWNRITSRLNTEDFPFIEFHAPRRKAASNAMYANLDMLYRRHTSVAALIEDAGQHPEFIKRLKRFEQAVPYILQGHFHYRQPDVLAARESYLQAARLCPEDRAVEALLEFPELRRVVKHDEDDVAAVAALAVVEWMNGNISQSKDLFRRILRLNPGGETGVPSGEQDFQTLPEALELCYQSSEDPYFRFLRSRIEQRIRSAPGTR